MAFTKEQEARFGRLLDLPEDQFDALLAPPAEPEAEGDTELTDEELQELLSSAEETPAEDAPADAEPVLAEAGASLSSEAQSAIDLANAQAAEATDEVRRMRKALDEAAFKSERDALVRKGIPLRFIECSNKHHDVCCARPLLEGEGRTVDLSNGKSADAGAIVRKLLTEFASMTKELGIGVELGTPLDGSDEAARAEEDKVTAERQRVIDYMKTSGALA